MKRLKVTVTEVKCGDPQDPRYDELYFMTATDGKSSVSKALRRIKRGTVIKRRVVIFDDDVNENSPILITAVEQRAIRDRCAAADLMEKLANQGLTLAKHRLSADPAGAENVWVQVGTFLLDGLVGLAKVVFGDSPLMTKVITEPYAEDVAYPVSYVMKGHSDTRPTYDYEAQIEVAYS